jgi:alpha-glucosidase (family GH31 glycosyl hydrolase)
VSALDAALRRSAADARRTGDNLADWEHLHGQTAMILSNNIAGMSFCGGE